MTTKMFNKASPLIFNRARELRNSMTDAEIVLWSFLKTNPLGYKFRRQHPFGIYITDFFCYSLNLVIEVDGPVHNNEAVKENDRERQKILEAEGIIIIRFTNDEVLKSLETVIEKITLILSKGPVNAKNITPL